MAYGNGSTNDDSYNKANKNYNFNHPGGDCANFVSQALHAGNFPENLTWGYTASGTLTQWGFDNGNGTTDWVNAGDLITYMISIGGTVVQPAQAAAGDIVHDTYGGASHDEIITGFATNGDILITCHNRDAVQFPILWYNDNGGSSYAYSEIVQPLDWVSY